MKLHRFIPKELRYRTGREVNVCCIIQAQTGARVGLYFVVRTRRSRYLFVSRWCSQAFDTVQTEAGVRAKRQIKEAGSHAVTRTVGIGSV